MKIPKNLTFNTGVDILQVQKGHLLGDISDAIKEAWSIYPYEPDERKFARFVWEQVSPKIDVYTLEVAKVLDRMRSTKTKRKARSKSTATTTSRL